MTAGRRLLALLAVVVILGTACSSSDSSEETEQDEPAQTTTSRPATSQPSSETTDPASPACQGLGAPATGGEITFVQGTRLLATSLTGGEPRCLLDQVPPGEVSVVWGGRADRALVAPWEVAIAGRTTPAELPSAPAERTILSRPEGKSVLAVTPDGKLFKRGVDDQKGDDVSYMTRHDEAIYHPAGRHIVSVGALEDDTYGIYLATNTGENVRPVAVAEEAENLRSLAFSQNGTALYFAAGHKDGRWHLHRVDLRTNELTDIADGVAVIDEIKVSSFQTRQIAWTQGNCAGGATHNVGVKIGDGAVQSVSVPGASAGPVGWAPDGSLIIRTEQGCGGAGDLYRWVPGSAPTLLIRNVTRAAVRAPVPPALALPGRPENDAPA